MTHLCMKCGSALCSDEISLYKKLIYRASTEYLCMDCLASELRTTRGKLQSLIDYYHQTGICSLFAKNTGVPE